MSGRWTYPKAVRTALPTLDSPTSIVTGLGVGSRDNQRTNLEDCAHVPMRETRVLTRDFLTATLRLVSARRRPSKRNELAPARRSLVQMLRPVRTTVDPSRRRLLSVMSIEQVSQPWASGSMRVSLSIPAADNKSVSSAVFISTLVKWRVWYPGESTGYEAGCPNPDDRFSGRTECAYV